MKVIEVEGTHTLQTTFSSLDVHVGQSYSVLVTADQTPRDYYVVVSSRFTSNVLTTTGILRYSNSAGAVSGPIPGGPTIQIDWSLNQARAIRYTNCAHKKASCRIWLVVPKSFDLLCLFVVGLTLQRADQDRIHKDHTTTV